MGIRAFLWIVCIYFLAIACKEEKEFSLPYEKYVLENGLEVVLHEDKSDPIVSVAIQYHVGSAKEKPGKTGFAHFFEHMLFQRSEHLGRNAFFKKFRNWAEHSMEVLLWMEPIIMKRFPGMPLKKCCGWSRTGWVFLSIRSLRPAWKGRSM